MEIITSLILISIFKYNKNTYNNFEYSLLIFTLINTTIIFIISRFICVTKKLSDFKDSLSYGMIEKIYYFIIIILLLVFATNNYNKLKFANNKFVEKIKIRGDKNGHETRFSRK